MYSHLKNFIKSFLFLHFFLGSYLFVIAQNNALVLNGAYIKLNNGTFANPIYLVVNKGSNQAIKRNSGHIISEKEGNYVRWMTGNSTVATSFIFPFGYSTTDFIPVSINKVPVGVVDNTSAVTVSTWATIADNTAWASTVTNMVGLAGANANNSAIDRNWQIMTASNVTATTDLYYRGAENTTTTAPTGTFSGQQWDAPTSNWMTGTGAGTGVTAGIGNVTGISVIPYGINTSSPYVLTAAAGPLPIELVSFTSTCDGKNTDIKWTNASEHEVRNIELQKSFDMNSWLTIYSAQASNTSFNTYYDYSYNETNNLTVYYRLKTNNNDGTSDLSPIIANAPCGLNSNNLSAFYYNTMLNVLTQFEMDAKVSYSLFDAQGKKLKTGEYIASKGEQMVSVPINELAAGIYIFNAESNSIFYNLKILIVN